jgi:alpha-mannosidase
MVDLPALGYRVFHLISTESPMKFPPVNASGTTLENESFRLEINPLTGCIADLYDKRFNNHVFKGEAARAEVIDDPSDTWSHNVFQFQDVIGAFQPTSVRITESGPVKSVIALSRMDLQMIGFTLYAGLDRIVCTPPWTGEKQKMLKLRFRLT